MVAKEECEAVGLRSYFKGGNEDLAVNCMRKFSKKRKTPRKTRRFEAVKEMERLGLGGVNRAGVLFGHIKLGPKVWSSKQRG